MVWARRTVLLGGFFKGLPVQGYVCGRCTYAIGQV